MHQLVDQLDCLDPVVKKDCTWRRQPEGPIGAPRSGFGGGGPQAPSGRCGRASAGAAPGFEFSKPGEFQFRMPLSCSTPAAVMRN